jgi:hypothetical protein
VSFWQAYRMSALLALHGALGGLAAVTPLIVAWYLTWRGWYLAALAVVIVAALVGLAVSARSLQWRS